MNMSVLNQIDDLLRGLEGKLDSPEAESGFDEQLWPSQKDEGGVVGPVQRRVFQIFQTLYYRLNQSATELTIARAGEDGGRIRRATQNVESWLVLRDEVESKLASLGLGCEAVYRDGLACSVMMTNGMREDDLPVLSGESFYRRVRL